MPRDDAHGGERGDTAAVTDTADATTTTKAAADGEPDAKTATCEDGALTTTADAGSPHAVPAGVGAGAGDGGGGTAAPRLVKAVVFSQWTTMLDLVEARRDFA
jgi:hypothetical protein